MPHGSQSFSDARVGGPAVEDTRAIPGTGIWAAPGGRIDKFRSWARASVVVSSRDAGEAYWRGYQPGIAITLSEFTGASVQFEGGPVQKIEPAAGRLSFRPAGVGIRTVISTPAPRHIYATVHQHPETYRDLACEVSYPANFGDLPPSLAFVDPQAVALVEAIVKETAGASAFDNLLVDALNTALAVHIARHFHGSALRLLPSGRLVPERLKRVLDYIEAHLSDPLSLNDLAAVACLSPFHFARCFKRSMGVGPHRYVMRRRIEHARRLVLHSTMPLIDVAFAVGFDSQSSFTGCFSREVGISPGRLRRESV